MRKCGNTSRCTRVKQYKGMEMYKYKQKRVLTSLKGKLERLTGGPGGMELRKVYWGPRYRCATLISNREKPHALSSMTWT